MPAVLNANSMEPDQTPRSAASDLGLHCLPMSHLWDVRHKWVKHSELPIHLNNALRALLSLWVIRPNVHIDKVHKNKLYSLNKETVWL